MKKLVSYPYILWMLVFIIVPLFFVAYSAFTNDAGEFTTVNFTSIVKYTPVFLNPRLAVVSTAICLLIAYPAGFYPFAQKPAFPGVLIMLVMLPMWINFRFAPMRG